MTNEIRDKVTLSDKDRTTISREARVLERLILLAYSITTGDDECIDSETGEYDQEELKLEAQKIVAMLDEREVPGRVVEERCELYAKVRIQSICGGCPEFKEDLIRGNTCKVKGKISRPAKQHEVNSGLAERGEG